LQELEAIMKKNENIREAHNRYENFIADDQLWYKYEAERIARMDQLSREDAAEKRGIKKGIEQGEIKGLEKTALALLSRNISVIEVCEITGLSELRVRELKAELEG